MMMPRTINRSTDRTSIPVEDLAVYEVAHTKAGAVRSVVSYVNHKTGEIIPAEELSIPVLDMRTKAGRKWEALMSLRPEVRAFATFVLKFANQRRGITPGIDTLCRWYADLHGKRAENVRRYVQRLRAADILAGDNLLGPLFQRTGGTARETLGEEVRAQTIYLREQWEMRGRVADARGPAAAPEQVAEEVARSEREEASIDRQWRTALAAMGLQTTPTGLRWVSDGTEWEPPGGYGSDPRGAVHSLPSAGEPHESSLSVV